LPTPKIFGSAFTRGPKIHSRHWPPNRLMPRVAIRLRNGKFGLSYSGMKAMPPISAPASAPVPTPPASTAKPFVLMFCATSQAP